LVVAVFRAVSVAPGERSEVAPSPTPGGTSLRSTPRIARQTESGGVTAAIRPAMSLACSRVNGGHRRRDVAPGHQVRHHLPDQGGLPGAGWRVHDRHRLAGPHPVQGAPSPTRRRSAAARPPGPPLGRRRRGGPHPASAGPGPDRRVPT
jgi:hypothetical protein